MHGSRRHSGVYMLLDPTLNSNHLFSGFEEERLLHYAPILDHFTLHHLGVEYENAVGIDFETLHVSHTDAYVRFSTLISEEGVVTLFPIDNDVFRASWYFLSGSPDAFAEHFSYLAIKQSKTEAEPA